MKLPENFRFRGLLLGYPKAGKSGSLIALLKAGYRIMYTDFDGNPEIMNLTPAEFRGNLEYLPFEDKVRAMRIGAQAQGAGTIAGISGEPKAYLNFMTFLETGKYLSVDGKEKEEHGGMASWDDKTILVLDSMTKLIDAIWRRFLYTAGRTMRTKRDWGTIVEELVFVIEMINSIRLDCHTITIAHLQLTGAEELEEADNSGKRTDVITHNNTLKQQKAELIGPRLFPRAVTKAQSEIIAAKFPVVLPMEVDDNGKRVFNLQPRKELSVSLPASSAALKKILPAETGLLDIFRAVTGNH